MKWYTKLLWNATTIGTLLGASFFWGYAQPKVNNVEITTSLSPKAIQTIQWTDECPKVLNIYGIPYKILVQEPNELIIEYCDKNPFQSS